MSSCLQCHGLQHARCPCPSLFPGVCSNSYLMSQWCHPTICLPLLLGLQSFLASESFPVRWLFASGGQSTRASASAISPSNEHSGLISFRIDWFDLLAVQGTLKNLLQQHSSKASILQCSAFSIIQLSHLYMTTGKTIALTIQLPTPIFWPREFHGLYVHGLAKYWTWLSNFHFDYMDLCRQSNISVLILCLVCHCFSKEQASFNLMAVVIIHSDFGAQEKNVCHCCHLFPIYLPWSHGTRCHDLRFFSVKPAFSLSFSASSRGSVIPLCFLPYGWSHLKP